MGAFTSAFQVRDTFDAVLLGSFFFGLVFSSLTLVTGIAGAGVGHGHAGHGSGDGHGGHGHGDQASFVSVGTVLAFLTWFGGVGYLVREGAGWGGPLSAAIGVAAGIGGARVIFLFMNVLHRGQTFLDGTRDRVIGSLGRVTSPIRAGGTGEMVYELRGVRHVVTARASDGETVLRGTEVVVVRLDRGVAYVDRWDDLYPDEFASLPALAEAQIHAPPDPDPDPERGIGR
ncbi:MAG: hypothetical protein ACR2OO_04370 [Thermomicrobiales bacterium]